MSRQRRTSVAESALLASPSWPGGTRGSASYGASDEAHTHRNAADRLLSEAGGLLTATEIDAIAEATARKLVAIFGEPIRTFGLVGPRDVADALGVSLDYVYGHAAELGAMRLGSGPKARIRFDLDRARQALENRARASRKRRR
jgi:hypothetical protein